MKVLWLTSWYPNYFSPFQGDFIQRHAQAAAQYVHITVVHIVQHGTEVEVPRKRIEIKESENLREYIIYFPFKKTGFSLLDKVRYNFRYYSSYIRFIRKHFKKSGVPDLIHVHIPIKSGLIAQWIRRRWKIPYLVSEHSNTYYAASADHFFDRGVFFRRATASVFRNANTVISVSEDHAQLLKNIFKITDCKIIRNVVPDCFYLKQDLPKEPFYFFHASTMDHQKNIKGIIRMLGRLRIKRKNWKCRFAGWHTLEIKHFASSLGLDEYVEWLGVISNERVAVEMQQSHALVMFSRSENFPCTIVEALSCGLPVIATDVGGIREAVNADNGILIQSENEKELLEAMIRMMDDYSQFNRSKIAADAAALYRYNIIGKQFFDLYQQVLTHTIPNAT